MLSAKPWKFEAILRLLLGVFICHFLGTIVVTAVRYAGQDAADKPALLFALVVGCAICCAGTLWSVRRPWRVERFEFQFITLLICLWLSLTLGWLAVHLAGKTSFGNATWQTVAAALSFQGVVIAFSARFAREHRQRWMEAFGFNNHWRMALTFGVLATGIILPVGWMLQGVSAEIMSRMHLEAPIQPAVQALQNSVTWMDRVTIGVVAVGLAPLGEELLFRGILYPAIKQAGYPRAAFWGTSFLFAAIHWNLPTFVPLLLLALVLTWLYEKTDNLLAPVAAHALFNALNLARFFYFEVQMNHAG